MSISFNPSNGNVSIVGSPAADVVDVSDITNDQIQIRFSNPNTSDSQDFDAGDVNLIVFTGGDGDDRFTNTTAIAANASGGDGNDFT